MRKNRKILISGSILKEELFLDFKTAHIEVFKIVCHSQNVLFFLGYVDKFGFDENYLKRFTILKMRFDCITHFMPTVLFYLVIALGYVKILFPLHGVTVYCS